MLTPISTLRPMLRIGLILCLLLLPDGMAAQSATFPSEVQAAITTFTVYIIAGMNLLSWLAFHYLTILLDPVFIFNTQQGAAAFTNSLNSIWMLARDLMNIVFALALIGAAVYTIVTAKKDFVAAHIKTFVLAVILVNFSWFIPRVILDVSNVATSAIFGIPSLLAQTGISEECRFRTSIDMRPNIACNVIDPGPDGGATTYDCQCAMLVNARFFLKTGEASALENPAGTQLPEGAQGPIADTPAWECPLGSTMCLLFAPLNVNTVAGHSAVLNGLIVNHARLQDMVTVPPVQNESDVGAMIAFLLRQMIVLVIHAALFFPLAAMAAAFAIRIPVLWVTIAFMPFALLKFVVPQEYTGDYPQKIWDWFLKAAFLPAMVAVPLAIGFILVNAGSQLIHAAPMGIFENGQIKLFDSVSNTFELLWLLLTIAVLYVGVFSVLGKVEFVSPVTNFIKDMGKNAGQAALKLPLALPVIPGVGGGRTPLQMLKSLDPRAINYGLSHNPEGVKGVLANITGTGLGASAPNMSSTAQQFAENKNTQALIKLNQKLETMTRQVSAGEKPDYAAFARELRDELNINIPIDQEDPAASLRSFHNALASQSNVDRDALNGLDSAINGLRDTIDGAKPAQNPPSPAS